MHNPKIVSKLAALLGLCFTGTAALAADPPDFTGVWGTIASPAPPRRNAERRSRLSR